MVGTDTLPPEREDTSMLRTASLALPLLIAVPSLCSGPALAQGVAGKRVAVNGMRMYYEVSGQGDPLVVLHGAYMNIPTMGAIIPRLAKTHKVYAVELQGHGRTTDIARPITYPTWRTTSPSSWTQWVSGRPTCSATRWAPRPACSSPSAIRGR